MWLSGLSAGLQTKRWLVLFPVRARAWVAGQVPCWGGMRVSQSMFLSHTDVSLPLFLPPFPTLLKEKKGNEKNVLGCGFKKKQQLLQMNM